MKSNQVLKASIGVSLLIHVFLYGTANQVWIPGVAGVLEEAKKMFRIEAVDTEIPTESSRDAVNEYSEILKFQSPDTTAPYIASAKLDQTEKFELPDLSERLEAASESKPPTDHTHDPKADLTYKEKIDIKKRNTDLQHGSRFKAIERDAQRAVVSAGDELLEIPEAFTEEMFGFTPQAVRSSNQVFHDADKNHAYGSVPGAAGTRSFEAIDRFMNFRLVKWKEDSTGQGYFKLVISPGADAVNLESMSKEMIFLVDASLSIQEDRISQFKDGIRYCLRNLNPGDRFNIFTFKEDIRRFAPKTVPVTPEAVDRAMQFLDQLEPSQKTDIYEAFLESIGIPAELYPSYIVFLSDGRPTTGITSSAKLIEEISRRNDQKRSIFSFSGGRKVNRYLLDFLSYQNRGWAEYASSKKRIFPKISEFYDKIRYPLLRNVRIQFTEINANEVYPKDLSDFYRNTEFVVYGRYKDEKEFSVRILGEINGKVKELIFKLDLENAEVGKREISRIWAFNKIYNLISQLSLRGENDAIRNRIRALSEEFYITTPYDLEVDERN